LFRSRSEAFEEKQPLYARNHHGRDFTAIVFVALALIYAFSGSSVQITERLGRLWRPPAQERMGLKETRQKLNDTILSGSPRSFLPRPAHLRNQTSS